MVKTQLISVIALRAVDDAEPFCSNYSVSIHLMARPLSSPLIGQLMSVSASDWLLSLALCRTCPSGMSHIIITPPLLFPV